MLYSRKQNKFIPFTLVLIYFDLTKLFFTVDYLLNRNATYHKQYDRIDYMLDSAMLGVSH